jgi:RNA polymerase sigma factor (sigma-70 family)
MYHASGEEADRLVASARCDADSLDAVYRREAPKLYSFLRRRIWQEEDRQDLVQEAFTRLAASRSIAASKDPGAYVQGILRHLLADRVRAWARTRRGEANAPDVQTQAPSPDAVAEINQMQNKYRLAVSLLPPRTREVYLLHRAEELGYKEIAEQLGISVRTVEWHVAEAIVRIGKSIGSDHG